MHDGTRGGAPCARVHLRTQNSGNGSITKAYTSPGMPFAPSTHCANASQSHGTAPLSPLQDRWAHQCRSQSRTGPGTGVMRTKATGSTPASGRAVVCTGAPRTRPPHAAKQVHDCACGRGPALCAQAHGGCGGSVRSKPGGGAPSAAARWPGSTGVATSSSPRRSSCFTCGTAPSS